MEFSLIWFVEDAGGIRRRGGRAQSGISGPLVLGISQLQFISYMEVGLGWSRISGPLLLPVGY